MLKKLGEETFLFFHQFKGCGEGGERHLEEAKRVFEDDVFTIDGYRDRILAPINDDLVRNDVPLIKVVQDKVAIETLRIVGEDREFEISQPIQ